MLAKIHIFLPFGLTCPVNTSYRIWTNDINGYAVQILPPQRSDRPAMPSDPEHIKLDGVDAYEADVFVAIFKKESFVRKIGAPLDPAPDVILSILNSFLGRLKYVSRAMQIKEITDFKAMQWSLEYLNDDGSQLSPEEGLFRVQHSRRFHFQTVRCDPPIWNTVFSLPPTFESPPWRVLLTDAHAALPHIGTSVVLAATALETFIAEILNAHVKLTPIPDPLWAWICDRSSYLQRPTVEEKFDSLLKIVAGHSLKENETLWTAFMHLKAARNKFVHEGEARIGGIKVDEQAARRLIHKAEDIVGCIREWLPPQLQWPIFVIPDAQIEFGKTIIKGNRTDPGARQNPS